MKKALIAFVTLLFVSAFFGGCIPEKKPRTGVPIGVPMLDVSGMWIGQDCYMTLSQKGDKLEGSTKMRYTRAVRQYKGTIDGNQVVLNSLTGNASYKLIVQKKRMNGTYNDPNTTDKPVTFKR
jgi:hypothetical protein